MARCTNCQEKWKIKEVIALGFSKRGRNCPSCGERQYISTETQKILTLGWLSLIFVPFLFSRIKLSNKEENLLD